MIPEVWHVRGWARGARPGSGRQEPSVPRLRLRYSGPCGTALRAALDPLPPARQKPHPGGRAQKCSTRRTRYRCFAREGNGYEAQLPSTSHRNADASGPGCRRTEAGRTRWSTLTATAVGAGPNAPLSAISQIQLRDDLEAHVSDRASDLNFLDDEAHRACGYRHDFQPDCPAPSTGPAGLLRRALSSGLDSPERARDRLRAVMDRARG